MSPEGAKVCTYYQIHSFPVIMVIHPRTGQRKKMWEGAVQPDKLLEVRQDDYGVSCSWNESASAGMESA